MKNNNEIELVGLYGSAEIKDKVFQPYKIIINKEDLRSIIAEHGQEYILRTATNSILEAVKQVINETNSK